MEKETITVLLVIVYIGLMSLMAIYYSYFEKPNVTQHDGLDEIWLRFHQLPAGTVFTYFMPYGMQSHGYIAENAFEKTQTIYVLFGADVPKRRDGTPQEIFITPDKMNRFSKPAHERALF